jgi:uncharacterized DUF497 family protein
MQDDEFEWDDAKAEANYQKHGVDFETATEVFADLFAIEELDPGSDDHGEDRYRITGMGGGALLVVVYTEREERIRIISARRATKREHDDYYHQNSKE